jgi:enoyl-CoA hydratase/carnithine racemase
MSSSSAAPTIRREITDDGICVLTFDRPESGANIFDAATLRDLSEQLDFIEKESSLKGVIVTSAKKSIFVAGADLQTLLRQAQSGGMRAFIAKVSAFSIDSQRSRFQPSRRSTVPVRAVVTRSHSHVTGASLPMRRRHGIGLPETTLGLVPAWGGATRLPRLIGPEKAAEVILKGKLYPASEALQLGLVDELVPQEKLMEAARKEAGLAEASSSGGTCFRTVQSRRRVRRILLRHGAAEIINQSLTSSIEESMQRELDAIRCAGRNRIDPQSDSQFLSRREVQKAERQSA